MTPFLTDLDSRAAIKGSRDPLGVVPVWSRVGRFVVGNLTTPSSSVRSFTTLLLGLHFAAAIHEEDESGEDNTIDAFIRFEQMAAYCRRHYNGTEASDIRGVEAVDRYLAHAGSAGKVTLSANPGEQILASQKTYGIWGLFRMPARESGLVEADLCHLTPVAAEFVERHYIPRLPNAGTRGDADVLRILRATRSELQLAGRHEASARALASILKRKYSSQEKDFYWNHLVLGGDGAKPDLDGRQAQLVQLMESLPPGAFGYEQFRSILSAARKRGAEFEDLHQHLAWIDTLESLIVPAQRLFLFLLSRDGQTLRSVAGEVEECWPGGLRFIRPDAVEPLREHFVKTNGTEDSGARWMEIARSLSLGQYEGVLRLLIEENAAIMKRRDGSAPWAHVEKSRIELRFFDEGGDLPPMKALPDMWQSTYFINSLKSVMDELRRDA